jgi:hypothetical protein
LLKNMRSVAESILGSRRLDRLGDHDAAVRLAVYADDQRRPSQYRGHGTASETHAAAHPGTEGATFPFFSPDGPWIGFQIAW